MSATRPRRRSLNDSVSTGRALRSVKCQFDADKKIRFPLSVSQNRTRGFVSRDVEIIIALMAFKRHALQMLSVTHTWESKRAIATRLETQVIAPTHPGLARIECICVTVVKVCWQNG